MHVRQVARVDLVLMLAQVDTLKRCRVVRQTTATRLARVERIVLHVAKPHREVLCPLRFFLY
jgi:hypothetical protein